MRKITFVITIIIHLLLSSFLIAISSCTSITPISVTSKLDSIISDSTNVIKTNPRDADAYVKRGSAYAAKGQLDRAISDFNKALEIDPMYAEAYNMRGATYAQMGLDAQAISDYNKSLEINPMNNDAYYNRGLAYSRIAEYNPKPSLISTRYWKETQRMLGPTITRPWFVRG